MKTLITPFVLLCFILGITQSSFAQEKERELLTETLQSWEATRQHIQIQDFKTKKHPDSIRFMSATVVLFGEPTHMEVEFKDGKKRRLKRLYMNLPDGYALSSEHFRSLFGKSVDSVLPQGAGMSMKLNEFEIILEDSRKNRVEEVMVSISLGSWQPFKESDDLMLNDFHGKFRVKDIQGSNQKLNIDLGSSLFIPESLARQIGIGQTQFACTGSIDTENQIFSISANLSSQSIPIVPDKSIVLTGADLFLEVIKGKPEFSLGGQMKLMSDNKEIMPALNGRVSIDVKGSIYGEAWMDRTPWVNPFGMNENLTITNLGFGFGLNLITTPIPTPIIALEGGVIVRSPIKNRPPFKGKATLGVNMGDPTQNMIDAEFDNVYLSDLIAAFSPKGTVRGMAKELGKVHFTDLHLTVVPPGPGVDLLGVNYAPGFLAKGKFEYAESAIRGGMFVKINESELQVYGGLTPIRYKGFSFTGIESGQGPSLYISKEQDPSSPLVMAINGKLNVMGVSSKTHVYMSDAGFSVDLEGDIHGSFKTQLKVSGKDLIKGEGLYVKAMMKDETNLVQKISEEASQEIEREAKKVKERYDNAASDLEKFRPQMNQAQKDLTAKQNEVRKQWAEWCKLLDQRAAQDAERKKMESQIAQLKKKINNKEAKLKNDRYRSAKVLNPTTCSGNSKPYNDYCYSPAPGYKWDIAQPVGGAKATFTPEKRETKSPVVKGTYTLVGGCPSGQFGDATTGKCYTCPPGYKKDGLATNCVKITPVQYKPAVKGQYIGCGQGRSIPDLTTGKCWECPEGYERKVSTHPITGAKACELVNLGSREGEIRDLRAKLVLLEAELNIINKGIGELATQLTGVASDVCDKLKDTDAINADPAVYPYFKKWSDLSLMVNEVKDIIKFTGDTQVGALNAAAWVVKNGGTALGVVDIDYAEFEGCLSNVQGGTVALQVKGSFAGNPLNASLKINLKSPEQAIKQFAAELMGNPNPVTSYSNGGCKAPNVPVPQISDGEMAEIMKFVKEGSSIELKERPRRETTPDWAVHSIK